MSECTHHWQLEEPNGTPLVQGTCRHCGASQEFCVSPETKEWRQIADRKIRGRRRQQQPPVGKREAAS